MKVVYVVTSATGRAAPPAVLAAGASHSIVESTLHWVRDVTLALNC